MKTSTRPIGELLEVLCEDLSVTDIKKADVLSTIAVEISKARIDRNMNQKEFANLIGVSQGMVSRWENGNCNFTIETLVDIFCKLGKDLYLCFEKPVSTISNVITGNFPSASAWNTKRPSAVKADKIEEEAV